VVFFSNVSKKYDKAKRFALDKVSFYIEKGEFVFIIGSSGAGKSTLTKLMLAEETITSGSISINGTDVGALKRRDIPAYRRSLGMVFQDFRLLASKNVYDNVAFAMQIRNASQKEIRRTVPGLLSIVGLSDKAKAMPNQLSGGEQQRVALARAMANNPAVLIADEPTGNLDPGTSDEIMELFDAINKRGTTVIIITHDKEIVDKYQKRVIELDMGSMVRDSEGGYENEK